MKQKEAKSCLKHLFETSPTTAEIISLLTAINNRGESVDEIVGFAQAMRDASIKVKAEKPCIDVCGTGGSGKERFNVSTASAFVLAAMGIRVVKHGNHGSQKPNGSFDFLAALGIPFPIELPVLEKLIKEKNLGFIYARSHHPGMAKIGPARKAFGKRSIFNLLGPLTNPALPNYNLIGSTHIDIATKLAQAAQLLGYTRTVLAVGANGLDEVSLAGESQLLEVTASSINKITLHPSDVGLKEREESVLEGERDVEKNARLFKQLLKDGNTDHPITQMIALNAGVAATVIGHTNTYDKGVLSALEAIGNKQVYAFYLDYT